MSLSTSTWPTLRSLQSSVFTQESSHSLNSATSIRCHSSVARCLECSDVSVVNDSYRVLVST
jgi:hypothetical protein